MGLKRKPIRRMSQKQRDRTEHLRQLWEVLYAELGGRCARCNTDRPPLDVHHLLSRARGGQDELENLTLLCRSCHTMVTDHTCDDWERWTRSARRSSGTGQKG